MGHRVRLVWAFAEKLDLAPLYAAIKAVEGRPGHPPATGEDGEQDNTTAPNPTG